MRIRAIDISKLAIYGVFFNYYCYNIIFGSFIPMGTYAFSAVAIVGVLISASKEPIKIDFDIKCWIFYFIFSVATIVVAYNPQSAIDGLFKYFQRLVMIILITYICKKEHSINFAMRLLAVTAVLCAVSSFMTMTDYTQKLTMESGATVSTNDIGSLMAFGCFAVVFAFGTGENSKMYKTIIKIGYILAALSVISIAGSRKSLIAIIIIFGCIFLLCWKDYFQKMTSLQFVSIVIVGIIAIYVVGNFLLPYFEGTNMYARLFGRRAESTAQSDESRINLYVTAINVFWNHLLFGVGFNNFIYLHGNYTHSTYVEPLACSGVFGFLYLIPYGHIFANQYKLAFSKEERFATENRVFQKQLFAFLIAFLFVGIGIPYLYKDIPCIILAMFISWQSISISEKQKCVLSK